MSYATTIHLDLPVPEARERVEAALAEQGFGILTEIDLQAKLIDKVGEDVGPYIILGACNPGLAHRALAVDGDIGALLPCSIVLRGAGDGTDVVAADPMAMLQVAGDGLAEVGRDAADRLERALTSLRA